MAATDFDAWVQAARSVPIESVLTRRGVHLRKSGVERVGPCPKCGGTDRFSINVKEGVWNCRGCKPESISGDVIGLVEWLDGVDFKTAVETLEGTRFNSGGNGQAKSNGHAFNDARAEQLGPIVAIYPYLDESARLLFQVTRHDPKDFRQRQPDGNGGWINHTRDVRMVPYRLPELIEAGALDRTIFILEGEKDVDNAVNLLGVPATTNPRGAGKWANCKIDQFFQDLHVVIVADNDPQTRNKKTGELLYHADGRPRYAGFDHAQEVAQHLDSVAASVKVMDLKAVWPGCPEKGDLTDWIKAGGTAEALNQIVEQLPAWTPGQQPAAALIILRLEDWLARQLPEPDCLLGNWLTTTTRGIINAPTGLGKTMLGIGLAMRMSANMGFLNWKAIRPATVLFIDGEMSRKLLQRRLRAEVERCGQSPAGLHILSHEDIENFAPLNTPAGQQQIENVLKRIGRVDFIFFDNIMSLIAGDMKEEEGWRQALPWIKSLTKRAIGQLWVHHTGHDVTHGYGTKTREWQMDVVGHLEKLERTNTDVAFQFRFTKARDRTPENRSEFADVHIMLIDEVWEWKPAARVNVQTLKKISPVAAKFLEVLSDTISNADMKLNGYPATYLEHWRKRCIKRGLLDNDKPNSARSMFSKYRTALLAAERIEIDGELVRLVGTSTYQSVMEFDA